jgi:hypothetical protein
MDQDENSAVKWRIQRDTETDVITLNEGWFLDYVKPLSISRGETMNKKQRNDFLNLELQL